MKKSISILAMIAGILLGAWVFSGKAHAVSVLTGDPYCDEPLVAAITAEREYRLAKSRGEQTRQHLANYMVFRAFYILNTCSVDIWNAASGLTPMTKETLKDYREWIRPQTFIN